MSSFKEVRFTYVPLPPFVEKRNETGRIVLGGFMPAMIRAIAKWMNFTPIFVQEPNNQFGAMAEDGTWGGMNGMICRNEVDVTMSAMAPFGNVLKFGTYSNPVAIEKYAMLSGKKIQEAGFFLFFNVLDVQVWIGTFVSLILLAFSIASSYQNLHGNMPNRKFYKILLEYVWALYAYIMQQGVNPKWTTGPSTTTDRISWLIPMQMMLWIIGVAFLIMNMFKGGLLSLLTILKSIPLVDTMTDLIAKSEITATSAKGIVLEMALQGSGIPIFDSMWQRVESNLIPDETLFQDIMLIQTEAGKRILIHGYLILQSVLDKRFESEGQCNFHIASETFYTFSLANVMRKTLPEEFKEKFNYGITRLVDADIPGKWFKSIQRGADLCQKYFKNELKPLGIKHIYGVLALWCGGVIVAMIVFALETYLSKQNKRETKRPRTSQNY